MTDNRKDGGPAFPQKEPLSSDWGGMTLRDYFAAKVAAGDAAADTGWSNGVEEAQIADRASLYYRIADAMLAAREKGGAA